MDHTHYRPIATTARIAVAIVVIALHGAVLWLPGAQGGNVAAASSVPAVSTSA
jgi:hypothetical protein